MIVWEQVGIDKEYLNQIFFDFGDHRPRRARVEGTYAATAKTRYLLWQSARY